VRSPWDEVEIFCPVCQEWKATGAGTTAENMKSDTPLVKGGAPRVVAVFPVVTR
jgi:hypothetical protein